VYNWLHRFEEDSIKNTASDKAHPGRPPKLGREEQSEVTELLHESPANAGYDAAEWSILLVQRLLDEQIDVPYSRLSAYKLLSNLGNLF
jgi:transposase